MINKQMIGIVGGMGSYATAYFFRKLLDAFPAEKEWDRPRIIIDNNCVMPSRVRAILYGENHSKLVKELSDSVNGLINLGCGYVVLTCITSHYFLDQLHIVDKSCVVDLIQSTVEIFKNEEDIQTASMLVLGSEGTTHLHLWDSYFKAYPYVIEYPNKQQLTELRTFIEAVKQNSITEEVVNEFGRFLTALDQKYIILGCTELPVLFEKISTKINDKRIIDPLQCVINKIKGQFIL